MATIEDFEKLDIRLGRVTDVQEFPEARRPAYKLLIDFGPEIGVKKSCAQLPQNYTKEELSGRLVLCVTNFPPRQIGPAVSEVLTLGIPNEKGEAVLVGVDRDLPLGGRLY